MQGSLPQAIQARQQTLRYGAVFAVFKFMMVAASTVLAATLGPWAVAACGEPKNGTVSENATLHVDIFSGRPNPVYALTDAESDRIADALRGLSESPDPMKAPVALGFRGFKVSSLQLDGARVALTVVFDQLAIAGNDRSTRFADAKLSLHELLLQLVRERDPDIASAVDESS